MTLGEDSWEKAESALHREAVTRALAKAEKTPSQVDMIFSGDLLNRCVGTTFSIRELNIPFTGLYGACSTMALSLALAGLMTDGGIIDTAIAATSSHFCSAEKQFRQPQNMVDKSHQVLSDGNSRGCLLKRWKRRGD